MENDSVFTKDITWYTLTLGNKSYKLDCGCEYRPVRTKVISPKMGITAGGASTVFKLMSVLVVLAVCAIIPEFSFVDCFF